MINKNLPKTKLQIPPSAYWTKLLLSSDIRSKNKSMTFNLRRNSKLIGSYAKLAKFASTCSFASEKKISLHLYTDILLTS